MSKVIVIGSLLRCAGANAAGKNNPQQSGISLGGIYTPAYTLNGRAYSARWEGSFYHQLPAREGQEEKSVIIRVTGWNGRNASPGKGLADHLAKYVSAGKAICCELDVVQYMSRIFVDNQPVVNSAGQVHLEPKLGFRMRPGSLQFGNDSAKQVDLEIQNWNRNPGVVGFTARPPQWNVAGTQDNLVWTTSILPARSAASYTGGNTYGYALVGSIPQGAVPAVPGTGSVDMNSGPVMPSGPGGPGGPAGPTSPTLIDGFTIEQYRAQGWSDAQMIAEPKFAPFIAAGLLGNNMSTTGLSAGTAGAGEATPFTF